ncbi:MOSC domain-containing protein YiiM [Saccharopolyspora kobensis]|uniref:MOSC domain-containing protein YiiM n=1 Tax=Saccharopolyspora kobensis TaxID=146035 RepID=A0A1H6E5M7_9PSEU|nr:MOSC domain-containing protein [Saccharopolyspora kobensis]SEG92266.1 MOSC domain-containing protein YiiM [Saccharopolyspora kobensis]SFD36326.1 MOSC domain-containing protein YiiM [Saccharopolyspora kobensis]
MLALSVNVGIARPLAAKSGQSGIDKRPVHTPVAVREPRAGGSGLAGDTICDTANHGGRDQAVYAYAREDLDRWEPELGALRCGAFGENLTTSGVDVTGALIGERWRIGRDVVLQVTVPRIPCRTFAVWLDRGGWVKTFVQRAVPGAYLSVVAPGDISTGDAIDVEHRPDHGVAIGTVFRALTTQPDLLPRLVDVPELPEDVRSRAAARSPYVLD